MITERTLQCTACGNEFPFSAEEQEFFQSKGFQEPKKCKPCRIAAKQSRGGGQFQRQLYQATCANCGIETQVPFQPNGFKPVYCNECYQAS